MIRRGYGLEQAFLTSCIRSLKTLSGDVPELLIRVILTAKGRHRQKPEIFSSKRRGLVRFRGNGSPMLDKPIRNGQKRIHQTGRHLVSLQGIVNSS
jgi:hypothetical protein